MKEIKKAIVYIIIGASLLFLVTGTVGAQAIATYKYRQIHNFEKLSNELIDTNNVTVYKFTDGNVTCYGSYAVNPSNRQSTGTSLTCLK